MKRIVVFVCCIIQLNIVTAKEVSNRVDCALETNITTTIDLNLKKVKRIISRVAPRFELTEVEAMYHYRKGDLTITEAEDNQTYIIIFDGILEILIVDSQG